MVPESSDAPSELGSPATGSLSPTEPEPSAATTPTSAAAPAPKRTRASEAYLTAGVSLVLLIIVLDFIIQNLHQASIHFITFHFRLPIGILVLGGAVAGGVIVLLISLFRVLQLRHHNRRHRV